MISNNITAADIDIDKFFDDPKNIIPEVQEVPDYSMQDEIDKVLNDALAQIDEHQRIIFPALHTQIKQEYHEDQGMLPVKREFEAGATMKPLSPASLLSDDSQISSPNDLFSHIDQSPDLQIEPSVDYAKLYEQQVKENERLKREHNSFKSAYEFKVKALEKAVHELKKSEVTRFKLMEENRELKKIVTSLTINEQV